MIEPERAFFARPPLAVLAVALFAGVLHMLPWLHAWAVTPEDWSFTANVTVSPDAMQYRTWMRQALVQGPLVDDRFTTEVHEPFLPVVYYWAVAHLGRLTGLTPEWANAWLGVPLAIAFALLVWWTVRWFLGRGALAWLVYGGILFGGGLTAHLKLLNKFAIAREAPIVGRLVAAAHLSEAPTFEDSRFHYVIRALFDSHFLLIWLWTLGGLLSLYFALVRPSRWRSLATAALFAGLTLIHVYEGVTVIAIGLCVTLFCWFRGVAVRPALGTLAASTVAVGASLAWMYAQQRGSGLPFPDWAAPSFPVANILMAFPIAWVLVAFGAAELWRKARIEECFLLGWALACTAILLSHPYYPYHDRGAVSLQVVLFVLAGLVWQRRRGPLTPRAALVACLVLGAAPLFHAHRWWRVTDFTADAPWMFQSPEDREVVRILSESASPESLLVAGDRDYRWLYPEYPGRGWDAHFFLTVDFQRKNDAKESFLADPRGDQADLPAREGVDFVFVSVVRDPRRFADLPGFEPLFEGRRGTLFRVADDGR